jgi:hypothetical protein
VSNSNALAIYSKIENPIAASKEMALSVASMIGGTSAAQGEAIALVCMCDGIHPLDFSRRYHWIPGKGPSMRADAMLGEFELNNGGSYVLLVNTPAEAAMEFTRADGKIFTQRLTCRQCLLSRWPWAKEKANGPMGWEKANAEVYRLINEGQTDEQIFYAMMPHYKDNWGTEFDWQNMLLARLISMSMRGICAKLVAGVYTPEEMDDVDAVEAVSFTPPKPTPTAAEVMARQKFNQAAPGTIIGASIKTNESSPIVQNGQPADVVIDVTPTSVKVENATPEPPFDAKFPQTATYIDGNTPLGNGHATRSQLDRLLSLRSEMNLSDTDWNAALAKRKVNAAHSLTSEQAAELIGKMEGVVRAAAKN